MSFFISAVIFASLLTGVVVGRWDPSLPIRLGGISLAIITMSLGAFALRGRRSKLYPLVLALAAGVIAVLALHLSKSATPLPVRTLQLGAVLCWGAIVLAGVLRALRLTDEGRGLLLGFSIA